MRSNRTLISEGSLLTPTLSSEEEREPVHSLVDPPSALTDFSQSFWFDSPIF